MEDEITAEATDPEGRRVVLADVVWREKIVRDHPEIDMHLSDVLQAVTKPDHVGPTRSSPRGLATTRGASVQVDGCWSS
jgi:hypothetical protein